MTTLTAVANIGVAGRNEFFFPGGLNEPTTIYAMDGHDIVFVLDAADTVFGGLGRDFILANGGNDTIYGDQVWNDETTNANNALAAEADCIFGMNGADTILAGGGNNFVNGGNGDDYITGGNGRELLQGSYGNDTVYGAAGDDILAGGSASGADNIAFLNSNVGNFTTNFDGSNDLPRTDNVITTNYALVDLALASTGNDYLDGGLGDDRLYGGDGADTMIGGLGNDSYTVDNASDLVIEQEAQGTDEIYLDITLSLASYVENVTLTNSTEGVLGNALANRINGNAAANYLAGAEGNDTITGGLNADRLIGGTGADVYVYNAVNEGGDRVLDFSSSDDTFHFRASAFGGLPAGQLDGSRFQSSNGDTAANSTIRFFYEEDTRILRYDADGIDNASAPVIIATLQEGASFSISDSVLI